MTRARDEYKTPALQESAQLDRRYEKHAKVHPKQLLEAMVHPKVSSKAQVQAAGSHHHCYHA